MNRTNLLLLGGAGLLAIAATVVTLTSPAPQPPEPVPVEALEPVPQALSADLIDGTGPQQVAPEAFTAVEADYEVAVLQEGQGTPLEEGQLIVLDLHLWSPEGHHFQGSETHHTSFSQHTLLPGVYKALAGHQEGVALQIKLPSRLAYGHIGRGDIPADQPLVAEVHVKRIVGQRARGTRVPDHDASAWQPLSDGVRMITLQPGSGPTPAEGDRILVDYTIWLPGTDAPLQSSRSRPMAESIPYGTRRMLPALESAIAQMQPGQRVLLDVPPEQGFGTRSAAMQGRIPAGSRLLVEVELYDILSDGSSDTP